MIKPKAVVWDVDDVLTPTSVTFYESAHATHGQCAHPKYWTDYAWGKHIGLDEGKYLHQYLIDHAIIEKTKPYPYTKDALTLTHDKGLKNLLLSARTWHPDPHRTTTVWAQCHAFLDVIEGMYFSDIEHSKRRYLAEISEQYEIVAFVDDNALHAQSAIGLVPDIYLVEHGWNSKHRSAPDLHSVSTALDAAKHIVELY